MTLGLGISNINIISEEINNHDINTNFKPLRSVNSLTEEYNGTSPPEVSLNYSWYSWSNSSDVDGDGSNDTLNIYYNLTNFNVEGYIDIRFELSIFIGNTSTNYSNYYDSRYFTEYVRPNSTYLFSWSWGARDEGLNNYSVYVVQYERENYNYYAFGHELFSYENISKLNFVKDYGYELTKYDADSDGFNDSVNIYLRINFTTNLDLRIDYFITNYIWDSNINDWQGMITYYYSDYPNDSLEIYFTYRAPFDGDYRLNFTFFSDIQGQSFEVPIDFELSRFSLLDYYSGHLQTYDADTDGCDDTLELHYEFNFTVTEQVDMRIFISIYDGDMEIDGRYIWFSENVKAGEIYKFDFKWVSRYSGNFRLEVRFQGIDFSFDLIYEVYYNLQMCPFKFLKDYRIWSEDLDLTNNNVTDSVKIHAALKFTTTGHKKLAMGISVFKYVQDDWDYEDYFVTHFEGNVSTDQFYDCYYIFSAPSVDKYKFEITVLSVDDNYLTVLDMQSLIWTPEEDYKLIEDWTYTTKMLDMDSDTKTDGIEITIKLQFHYSGHVRFYIEANLAEDYIYYDFKASVFDQEVVTGQWYEIVFTFYAPKDGDFKIIMNCYSWDRSQRHFSVEIPWLDAYEAHLFSDFVFLFVERDANLDGYNDSVEISFNFVPILEGKLTFVVLIMVSYYDDTLDSWLPLPSNGDIAYHEVGFYSEEVMVGTWNNWTSSFAVPFEGDFNISVSIQAPFTRSTIRSSYLINDGHTFNGTAIQTEGFFNEEVEGEEIETGFISQINSSIGSIDLDVKLIIISAPNTNDPDTWNIETITETIEWNSDINNTLEWKYQHLIANNTPTLILLRVSYLGVKIYSETFFSSTAIMTEYYLPLEPITLPLETTTKATEQDSITTQPTMSSKLFPGWSVLTPLVVLLAISLLRLRKSSK